MTVERRKRSEDRTQRNERQPIGLSLVRAFASFVSFALLGAWCIGGGPLAAQNAPLARGAAHADPDSARIVTRDIAAFWSVFDRATTATLQSLVQTDYLDRGSPGLRDYIPRRIGSAFDLAKQIYTDRARYLAAREATLRASDAEPAIRASFRKLKSLYPAAVFPDVYFVIGRFNVGGSAYPDGLVIGTELYADPRQLPAIVAHELIHYQQAAPADGQTLLERAFSEGSADFLGEMICGAQINPAAHAYGLAHEHELWTEFARHLHDDTYYPWMYAKPPGDRPNDLGYFIGYRIAQAYYTRARDKRAAIRDILRVRDVDRLLRESGYAP